MRKLLFPLIFIIITLLSGCYKNNDLKIHLIDVGQGDSILIQTPQNKNILVDGGNENTEHIVKRYLKNKKVSTIDFIIATHPDADHIGGLDNVINNFNVKSIYMPEYEYDSNAYNNLLYSCKKNNVNIDYMYKEDFIDLEDNLSISVLAPSFIQENSNANSIIFKLDYKSKSFLFTGDANEKNEYDIIESFNLEDIDFLKVGHHGSKTSTSDIFLKEITPDIAVISCGYKNQYGHPHKSILENLLKNDVLVYRTDLSGDMIFYSDGNVIYTKEKHKQ